MGHSVGYFNLSIDKPLIGDMAETWGSDLSEMDEVDALLLIAAFAHAVWVESGSESSDDAYAVMSRMEELENGEKLALIKVLAQWLPDVS